MWGQKASIFHWRRSKTNPPNNYNPSFPSFKIMPMMGICLDGVVCRVSPSGPALPLALTLALSRCCWVFWGRGNFAKPRHSGESRNPEGIRL